MRDGTVVIFGAGATKACGGPLTNEILPYAFKHARDIERENFLELLESFLVENFHLPKQQSRRTEKSFPSLPLLIGLVDIALDRKHSFGPQWSAERLQDLRRSLDYVIFAVIEHALRRIRNHYLTLLDRLYRDSLGPPMLISLNYDIIADNALMALAERRESFAFPDYGCDVATPTYRESRRFGQLYKLHGSLNWLYCPACQRLDLGTSESSRRTVKAIDVLYREERSGRGDLHDRYSCHGSPCPDCETYVDPVLISPTHMKDYRNPHITQTWYHADRALRRADRVIIAGYSMPPDDVDVIYLLKRGLADLPAKRITVVEYDPKGRSPRRHPAGAAYCKLFGDEIDWHPEGFGDYVRRAAA